MGESRRIGRIVAWLLIPAGLFVLALVLARFLLPAETIRDQLAAGLEAATGAEVELGEASLKLVPRLGLRLDGGSIRGTGTALAQATGSAHDITDFHAEMTDLAVDLALGRLLTGRVGVAGFVLEGPALRVAWEGGETSLADYRVRVEGLQIPLVATDVRDAPPVAGLALPGDLAFDVQATVGGLVAQRALYERVAFSGRYRDRILTVPDLRADRGSGEIRGEVVLDFAVDPDGRFSFDAVAERVPADSLLAPWVPDLASRLSGPADAAVAGSFHMRDSDTVAATLTLDGSLAVGPGRLAAEDWLREAGPYLGSRQDLMTVEFTELRHAFQLEDGRYRVDGLAITGGPTEWSATGWVALGRELDLAVAVRFPPGFTPDLGALSVLAEGLRDDRGRIHLAFDLTGPVDRPAVGIDIQKLMKGVR